MSITSNKISTLLFPAIKALSAAKPFFEANSKDQANTTLKLHELTKKHEAHLDMLTAIANKTSNLPPPAATLPQWPSQTQTP